MDYNFAVESRNVYNAKGEIIPGYQSIERISDDACLGLHKSRYKLVPYENIVSGTIDAIQAANISKDYTTNFKLVDDGAKMRGEILFNDLTVEPAVGDFVKFRISFFSSYDGTWAFEMNADGLRLWCTNGCASPYAAARTKQRHMTSLNIESATAKIEMSMHNFFEEPERWNKWRSEKVSTHWVENFFSATIARAPTHIKSRKKINMIQLENLMQQWSREADQLGSNKWALYNTMTHWSSHTQDYKNPEVTRRNRELAVVSALSSKAWAE